MRWQYSRFFVHISALFDATRCYLVETFFTSFHSKRKCCFQTAATALSTAKHSLHLFDFWKSVFFRLRNGSLQMMYILVGRREWGIMNKLQYLIKPFQFPFSIHILALQSVVIFRCVLVSISFFRRFTWRCLENPLNFVNDMQRNQCFCNEHENSRTLKTKNETEMKQKREKHSQRKHKSKPSETLENFLCKS